MQAEPKYVVLCIAIPYQAPVCAWIVANSGPGRSAFAGGGRWRNGQCRGTGGVGHAAFSRCEEAVMHFGTDGTVGTAPELRWGSTTTPTA